MIIKGASGLGDAVYLYPIVKHYVTQTQDLRVMTNFPEIYADLKVKTIPFTKQHGDVNCNYCNRKYTKGTTQFEDMVINAGLENHDIQFEMPYKRKSRFISTPFEDDDTGMPLCVLPAPYLPMNSQKSKELLYNIDVVQELIDENMSFLFVQVGNDPIARFEVDYDFCGKTSVNDLLDICSLADIIITPPGNLLPMGEALNKKTFLIFSEKGLKSKDPFISSITPEKLITKSTTWFAIDTDEDLQEKFKQFLQAKIDNRQVKEQEIADYKVFY
jgi:hypothetical protein